MCVETTCRVCSYYTSAHVYMHTCHVCVWVRHGSTCVCVGITHEGVCGYDVHTCIFMRMHIDACVRLQGGEDS